MTVESARSGFAQRAGRGVVPLVGKRFEPLAATYPKECRRLAAKRLATGQLSMQDFVAQGVAMGMIALFRVSALDEELFRNLNHPAELREWHEEVRSTVRSFA